MNQFEEPNELLLETDIISSEEKKEILDRINDSFIIRHEYMSALGQLSAKSSGFALPFLISITAIICTILILLFSGIFINQNNESYYPKGFSNISGSEWEVLKVYMEETTKKLENKDFEINRYKDEIVTYDLKITTLKELLRSKTETEKRLEAERGKLLTEGIAEEDIASKITTLEEDLKSELTPAMITFYNLSIDDINRQIDRVLEDKTESEKKLKVSLDEYEILVTEKEQLKKDIQQKSDKISQVSEAIEAMKIMSEVTIQYEKENTFRAEINELYNEIFTSINKEEYNSALGKIKNLQIKIEESVHDDNINMTQLSFYVSFVNVLDDYVKKIMTSKEGDSVEASEIDKQNSVVSSSSLEEENEPESNDGISLVDNEPEEDLTQTIIEEINSSEELILLGEISLMQFDRISIELLSETDVKAGTEFYIFKSDDQNTERVLGSGVVTEVLENTASGKLESLFILSSKPEADDLIYIKPIPDS